MSEHWAALIIPPPDTNSFIDGHGIAVWALQFTPRVAHLDEAVVIEVESCLRLFGGEESLRARVTEESLEQGVERIGWAPTSLAALAFARCGVSDGFTEPLSTQHVHHAAFPGRLCRQAFHVPSDFYGFVEWTEQDVRFHCLSRELWCGLWPL